MEKFRNTPHSAQTFTLVLTNKLDNTEVFEKTEGCKIKNIFFVHEDSEVLLMGNASDQAFLIKTPDD